MGRPPEQHLGRPPEQHLGRPPEQHLDWAPEQHLGQAPEAWHKYGGESLESAHLHRSLAHWSPSERSRPKPEERVETCEMTDGGANELAFVPKDNLDWLTFPEI